jgi:hypothetical protein
VRTAGRALGERGAAANSRQASGQEVGARVATKGREVSKSGAVTGRSEAPEVLEWPNRDKTAAVSKESVLDVLARDTSDIARIVASIRDFDVLLGEAAALIGIEATAILRSFA